MTGEEAQLAMDLEANMTSEAGVLVLPSVGDQPPGGHPSTSHPRNEMHVEMKLISLEEIFQLLHRAHSLLKL